MSIYFEKARELGKLILESEQSINVADASAAYKNDPEAIRKMEEYQLYRQNVQQTMGSPDVDKETIQATTQKLAEMTLELKKDPIIGALVFAENEFNGFVNNVMNVLKATVTGTEAPTDEASCSSCSGSCDGCK